MKTLLILLILTALLGVLWHYLHRSYKWGISIYRDRSFRLWNILYGRIELFNSNFGIGVTLVDSRMGSGWYRALEIYLLIISVRILLNRKPK
jgi:hypothetical protein